MAALAEEFGLHPRQIGIALDYVADHGDEIEARVRANDRALAEAEKRAANRDRLLPDDDLIALATSTGRVIVTENAVDFAHVTTCAVLFVRKDWWPRTTLADRLAKSISTWAEHTPKPGDWPHRLPRRLR